MRNENMVTRILVRETRSAAEMKNRKRNMCTRQDKTRTSSLSASNASHAPRAHSAKCRQSRELHFHACATRRAFEQNRAFRSCGNFNVSAAVDRVDRILVCNVCPGSGILLDLC
jgi:hypothetical protein